MGKFDELPEGTSHDQLLDAMAALPPRLVRRIARFVGITKGTVKGKMAHLGLLKALDKKTDDILKGFNIAVATRNQRMKTLGSIASLLLANFLGKPEIGNFIKDATDGNRATEELLNKFKEMIENLNKEEETDDAPSDDDNN